METQRSSRRVLVALVGLIASLVVILPTTITPAAAAADPCGAGGNAISCENSKPGAPPSEWDIDGAGDSDIQGFSTDISVNVGGTIQFKVNTTASAYNIDIYRTGYYGGLGARKIASVTPSASLPQKQPACITDASVELYDCGNWGVSASWAVPATAVSGVYIAKLTRKDNGDDSHITFVVRDDSSHSDVLFQTSDPTWQAYNTYGGSDFYQGAANGRAYKISYNRPVVTRGNTGGRDAYFSSEFAMVRFMERNGYDVSYSSGLDTDRRGQLLTNHKTFMSVGHDEYWSAGQRANVEAARAAGVNLMFLSGNEVYWHTRYEPSTDASHTANRTLVSYKETWADAKIDPTNEWTGTWRDPRFASPSNGAGRPENGLTGTAYMANDSDLPVTVSASEGKTRLWRGTTLASQAAGTKTALAAHTVGYESDEDLDNGSRPAGLVDLSTTNGAVAQYLQDFGSVTKAGTTTHHVTLYRAPSGALVFSAGTIQWAWGLDQTHDGNGAAADSRMQQAQVNLFADFGAQPTTLMTGLVPASKSTDTTGPSTTITSPAAGSTAANGTKITATGTASDVGGQVAGVEASTDNGATWHPATGTASWSYTYIQHGQGQVPLKVRAVDDSANIGAADSVTRTITCPCSVYGAAVPATADSGDTSGVELGLKFTPTSDGYVSGVRFYKATGNTGTHTGTLWSASGQSLATVTFSNETASGWQTANFSSSVSVNAGTTYVVSYRAPSGHYSALNDGLWSQGIDADPLKVAGGFGTDPAGVYGDPGTFPSQSYHRGQYYVDPVFTATDSSPLTVTSQFPTNGSSSVPANTKVTATFSHAISASSLAVKVVDQNGATVAGTTAYDSASRTATFTPSAALAGFVKHTVTVTAQDSQGTAVSSGGSWSFTTAQSASQPGVCPCSLFDESMTPQTLQDSDVTAVTLGVRFSATVDGTVSGVKFYKGPNNTGTHVGALWSATGTKLATVTFTNESTSGWQTATFSQPVAVTKNTEYVATYRTSVGLYSSTANGLGAALSRDPLLTVTNAGRYSYADAFPTGTSSANYLVDVIFNKAASSIAITGQTPAPGAVDVDRTDPIKVDLSTSIKDGYQLTASIGGQAVAGTTTLSADRTGLTFTPTSALPQGATVNVSLTGVVSTDGAALGPKTWSYATSTSTDPVAETLFGNVVPASTDTDSSPLEVGVDFSPTVGGKITAIRFFKGAGNGGTHTGTLWTEAGQKLAGVTFTGETASGWQTGKLATPVTVAAGDELVVSYYAPQGHTSATSNFFTSAYTNGHLTAPAGNNGLYLYGATSGFPTFSYQSSNYFVDVSFVPDQSMKVVAKSPAGGDTNVSRAAPATITFSQPLASGYTMSLSAGGQPVAGTTTISPDSTKLTFTPTASLPASTSVTASVTGIVSAQGAALADQQWSLTTEAATGTPASYSLFADKTPATPSTNDSASVELGLGFTPSVAGNVTGIKFYKGTGNTGTHKGTLWSNTGTKLGSVTFTGETASGWQTATLATPVHLAAGTSYVVSYLAPKGHYSTTASYFSQPATSGPLTAPASGNGRYLYGAGGFPTNTYNGANYFVDLVFKPDSRDHNEHGTV